MAILKSYITLTNLKRIPETFLNRHLDALRDELTQQQIIDSKGKIKFQLLTHFLQEHCPQNLENFICSFALIAKPELYDRISAKLQYRGVETLPTDDLETLAAKLAEIDMYACNAIAARSLADESHAYNHYIPTVKHTAEPLSEEQIELLKQEIFSPYFKKTGKSNYIDIYAHLSGKFVFYCISHGSPKTREHSVGEPEETSFHTFRPELVDVVRINLQNAEISVYTKKGSGSEIKSFYVSTFGRAILPDADYVPHAKIDLRKLTDPRIFTVGEFADRIAKITPKNFIFESQDGLLEARKGVDRIYMKCVENKCSIHSMTFSVMFADNPKKKHKVVIHSASRAEFPVGVNEDIIEEYFYAKGLMRDFYHEEAFTLEEEPYLLSTR